MRILYFYQYFTTPQGAWSTRAYEFARRWVQAGDTVTVVTSVYDKSDLRPKGLFSKITVEGIEVRIINIRLSNKHGVFWRLLTFFVYALFASWSALTVPADVVLASSGPLTVGVPALVARYLRRRPLVFEVRDLWPEGAVQLGMVRSQLTLAMARSLERACYRAATRLVVLSEDMASWIRNHHSVKQIRVIPNAADNELFGNAAPLDPLPEWAQGKKLVLYTGSIGRMDDCRQIIQMAESLHAAGHTEIKIVLIGDGNERSMLEAEAKPNPNVHFLGLKPKREVAAWLRCASCALVVFRAVPILDTSSPNKLFDALAAGVPVVQTTQGWIKKLLEEQDCGLTVPPNDAAAMAAAVLRLTKEDTLAAVLSKNARRVALKLFDRGLLAGEMRQCLGEAAQAKATSRGRATFCQ